MALSQDEWLRRYRARIIYHQPDMSRELVDDYVTVDTYQALRLDFPDDPELAVDIDPDLAYVDRPPPKRNVTAKQPRRPSEASQRDD